MASGHLLLSCAKRAATTKIDLFAYLWQLPCALCSLNLNDIAPDTGVSSLRRVAFESLRQNVLRIKIIGQYEFALDFKLSRERSKKTEEVFLVGSRESEGKSKSPQALFLLPAFSFGEAKENADGQLQICTVYQPFERLLETPEASPMRGSCRRKATDEVDNVASTKLLPPHPSRPRRATFLS